MKEGPPAFADDPLVTISSDSTLLLRAFDLDPIELLAGGLGYGQLEASGILPRVQSGGLLDRKAEDDVAGSCLNRGLSHRADVKDGRWRVEAFEQVARANIVDADAESEVAQGRGGLKCVGDAVTVRIRKWRKPG